MKAKNVKTKVLKVGRKQTKAKLPQYKAKGTRKSPCKCLIVNSTGANTENLRNNRLSANSSEKNHLVSQTGLKRRKKKLSVEKESVTEARHSMDGSSESDGGSAEARLAGDRVSRRYGNAPKQQRNIGSPVIVEALSENLSSLSIPDVFRQSCENDICDVSYTLKTNSPKMDASVGVGQSVNPEDNCYSEGDDTRIRTRSKNRCKKRKDKKVFKNANNNVSSSPSEFNETALAAAECAENTNVDDRSRENSAAEMQSSTTEQEETNDVYEDHGPLRFYCLRNKVVVVMEKTARFSFTGKLVLKVMYGAVEAYGCTIGTDNGSTEIYSPRGYSSVSIETSDKSWRENEPDMWSLLSAEGVNRESKSKLTADIDEVQPGAAVILLSNLENKLTKFLNVFYPFRLFPKVRNLSYHSWTDPKRAEIILQSNIYFSNCAYKDLMIDPRVVQEVRDKMLNLWHEKKWSCTLIAGGKNVGKSTATRYLINSLLPVSRMVILVDVDPGQAECTPSGCISYSLIEQPLLGPNFTHLKTPLFQLYIGDVTVTRCVTRYIEGIKMLMDKLSSCPILSRLPIVVNTMGFTHGIGWDIVIFTIKLIRPSLVVQIMSEKPKNNYIGYLSKRVINSRELPWASWSRNVIDWSRPCEHKLCLVRSLAERKSVSRSETWNMEPYQQRELVTISYFSEILHESTSRYDASSFGINEAVPYVTPFASLFVSIPRASVPPSHVLRVMNGNIVALCGIDIKSNESQEETTTSVASGLRVLNGSPLCSCYGFGIVRGVDMEREELFINTPLTASMLQHVNYLVGCTPVPFTLLRSSQHKNVPYTGGSDTLPTTRKPRRGYVRMRNRQVQNNS